MFEQKFHDLIVYRKTTDLSLEVYRIARLFRPEDRYLARDMCNTVLIAATKMARGYANVTARDRRRCFSRSFCKLSRLEYHLMIVERLELRTPEQLEYARTLVAEIRRLLAVLENAWYDS